MVDDDGTLTDCGSYADGFLHPSPSSSTSGSSSSSSAAATSPAVPAWCKPAKVTFTLEGPAELAAVANADPLDLSSFSSPERYTFRGRATAIVRPGSSDRGAASTPAKLTLTASSPGLRPASIELRVAP